MELYIHNLNENKINIVKVKRLFKLINKLYNINHNEYVLLKPIMIYDKLSYIDSNNNIYNELSVIIGKFENNVYTYY
jgi:Leucine-rich repeat (LRR) protein